jgi:hypothetical protein
MSENRKGEEISSSRPENNIDPEFSAITHLWGSARGAK